ncbi:hypothetical protein RhiirA1_480898 [Rhizophagus irregularis]|uniref:Uncharacterized protein n=1 Tax=Rhizophagus irregularis TaxID=588596 RepID=A0A2N0QNR9_9GLOM|nr:hypothetical protein RhiirA1_480898 [Rhizophagus irregularis]
MFRRGQFSEQKTEQYLDNFFYKDENSAIQAPEAQVESSSVVPTPVPELEPKKEALVLGIDYITEEEAKKWKELDLEDHDRPEDLNQCMLLCHELEQLDPESARPPTKEELEEYEKRKINPEGNKSSSSGALHWGKNMISKEFERLGEITDEQEKDLEFREQEELGTALKRRAIAVHRAKVPKSHPDNGSDIRKMLESQRKRFREILDNLNDKPGKEKKEKKNSRTDWLRNTQIIVYNRNKINDYLSNAFEQFLYQVEERGESIVKTSGDQLQSVALLLPPSNSPGSKR